MKIYKTQKEVEKDIKDGVLEIDGDVKFECSISIEASIRVSGNISALDISALDISALDISALYISALDISALDIIARDISARNILYYAFCCVYQNIKCLSIKAKREPAHEPICLDGKLEIKNDSLKGKKVSVELDGKKYTATLD